jgi:hypothetical protein
MKSMQRSLQREEFSPRCKLAMRKTTLPNNVIASMVVVAASAHVMVTANRVGADSIAVVSKMIAASAFVAVAIGTRYLPLGALLFYFSDLSVATTQFVQTDFPYYVWGLPLYFAGQCLLARSVCNAVARPQTATPAKFA